MGRCVILNDKTNGNLNHYKIISSALFKGYCGKSDLYRQTKRPGGLIPGLRLLYPFLSYSHEFFCLSVKGKVSENVVVVNAAGAVLAALLCTLVALGGGFLFVNGYCHLKGGAVTIHLADHFIAF